MTGFYNTTGILTHHCSTDTGTNVTALDSIEIAISQLRTGPALATADVLVLNPGDWSAIRRIKDAYGRFMVAPDPTSDEANSLWGIPAIQTPLNPAKQGLLLDSGKFGRVAIREALAMRIGYSNSDFSRNLYRLVGEERLVLCVERPAAVLKISNLP
jgi:HK97 family phage major capsid protein